jgi:hypothetical protein
MQLSKSESNPYIGILLLYYEKYSDKALREFVDLMDLISDRSEIVVVINNLMIEKTVITLVKSLNVNRKIPLYLISGDNSIREFSGWQKALNLYRGSTFKSIVFANDTFVHHRNFNWWCKKSYSRYIQRIGLKSKPIACGSLMGSHKPLSLGHVEITRWISTSIFAMNMSAIKKLEKRIHPDHQDLLDWVPGLADEEAFFSDQLDKLMKEHLIRWLFKVDDNNSSWYGAASLTNNNAMSMKEKALCILSEKWLAMRMIMTGVEMSDPLGNYPNRFIYMLIRLFIK